jgi:hypothetical protein
MRLQSIAAFMLATALGLAGCKETDNKSDATFIKNADGYEITLYGVKSLMVHDPVSLIFHRTYKLESRIQVQSMEGRVDAAEVSVYEVSEFDKAREKKPPPPKGSADEWVLRKHEVDRRPKIRGELIFSGNTLTLNATEGTLNAAYTFNGTYRLKERR